MSSTPQQSRFHESAESGVTQYKALEPMAALSLMLAICSIYAAFDFLAGWPVLLMVIIFSLCSLCRIKSRPEVFTGRKAALLSLGLALFFTSIGSASYLTSEYMIRRQAETIGQEFLELIASEQPELAFQWILSPKERCQSTAKIWAFYRSNVEAGKKLREFVDKEGVRALLAIGKDAKIYPVGQPGYMVTSGTESVSQTYAIDFKSEGKEKTFFFGLLMRRFKSKTGEPQWKVVDYVGGLDPWKE